MKYANINALYVGSLRIKITFFREILHFISDEELKWLTVKQFAVHS